MGVATTAQQACYDVLVVIHQNIHGQTDNYFDR